MRRSRLSDQDVAALLERVACILSDLHLDGLALQRELGAIFSRMESVPEGAIEAQRLDLQSQVHADLAAFVTVLARDVARGQIDPKRLSEALRLGSLRRSLLDEPDATDDQSVVSGDVSIF